MTENEALSRMVAPGQRRPGKMMGGIIQIMITRACDKACINCTQGSNLGGKPSTMSVTQFEQAVLSLKDYFGVVGVFGGNPAMHPQFENICAVLREHVPYERRGLWCNHPKGKGKVMRETFNPSHSNLNVHMDIHAYTEFREDWPESNPVGLRQDSRHSPCFVAMKDILKKACPRCEGYYYDRDCDRCGNTGKVYDEEKAWGLISDCDINRHWSALIGTFRGELRAWFCEIAGAQSMLHENDPEYPDTGLDPTALHHPNTGRLNDGFPTMSWWRLGMQDFTGQVRKHCHECGVPLRGHGALALDPDAAEQVSVTHDGIYRPKTKGRRVELVTVPSQLGTPLRRMTAYLENSKL